MAKKKKSPPNPKKALEKAARIGIIDIKMERVDFSKSKAKPKNNVFKSGIDM